MDSYRPKRANTILSGEVLSVRFDVASPEDGPPFHQEHWSYLDQAGGKLRHEIAAAVKEQLGPEFDVRSLTFARGSITVLLVVGTVYYAISRYKSFIESVELLVSHLKDLIRRFFERLAPMPVSVSASWTPGPALVQSQLFAPTVALADPALVML